MSAAALAVTGAIGLGEAAVGFFKEKSANKKAKELAATRPKLKASPYLQDQLSLDESELSTGMSADAKEAYKEQTDADQSSSIGAITRLGGSPNDVGSVFARSENGRARLAMMKDNLRLNQIANLGRAREASEEEREKEFQFNEWAPWADEAQANAGQKAAGQSMVFSGLNTAAGGAMKFGEQQSSNTQFQKYLDTIVNGRGNRTVTNGGGNTNAVAEPAPVSATPTLDGLISGDFE